MANKSLQQKSHASFTRGRVKLECRMWPGKDWLFHMVETSIPDGSASPEKSCRISGSGVYQHLLCPIRNMDLETQVRLGWIGDTSTKLHLWSVFVTRTLLALRDAFAADRDTGQIVSELNRSGWCNPGGRVLKAELASCRGEFTACQSHSGSRTCTGNASPSGSS